MATTITQQPLYNRLTAGQEIIFAVTNPTITNTYTLVKIIAEVYVSDTPISVITDTPVGIFKSTPNNEGTAFFDFAPVIESYVKGDNLSGDNSTYKGGLVTLIGKLPIHLIDYYSINNNVLRFVKIRFKTEYLNTATPAAIVTDGTQALSNTLNVFNGYLKYSDRLSSNTIGFGFNDSKFDANPNLAPGDKAGTILSNAPLTQFANPTDYGTMAVISDESGVLGVDKIIISYYGDAGVISSETVFRTLANGAFDTNSGDTKDQILFIGCFPGNIRNWSTEFNSLLILGTVKYYIISVYNSTGSVIFNGMIVNLLCPNTKGFEPIRVTWLNQWGVWDYYTFNMKSTKSISTKGTTYQQLSGTWGGTTYRTDGFKGGKKTFRVNATEKITMNTDFVSETETEWFEEFINSPEAYVLEGYQSDLSLPALNNYVTPIRLTTSSYTFKTVANDKLIQYTFEVEKSKTLRTQSV